jgi:putative proteasome-type protease
MTYCVAAAASTGIVFASDSRTNAGTAEVASHSKMTVFEAPGERVVVLLSAGNLATSQSVITLLEERRREFMAKPTFFHAVEAVGETLREVLARDAAALAKSHIDAEASFIVGGQARGEPPRLFMVYPQGNFIEASRESPLLQLGETNYAKPLLEVALGFNSALDDAAKCLLLAMAVTMRLNVAVAAPVDLLAYEKDQLRVTRRRRFEQDDAYLAQLSGLWPRAMNELCGRAPAVAFP